ncbi:MAG: DUF5711 family protein [Oscillospiraceae bacterium]|jgi:hypothetical protein|nr:DUF5711 family protein [Oscillospiraceae bacterium]
MEKTINDYQLHKRKRRIRKWISFAVAVFFLFVAINGVNIFIENRTKFIGAIPTSQIFANKNGKSFPINLAQGIDVKTTTFGNNFFVLIGENFNIYNIDGNLVRGKRIDYENAVTVANDKRVLVYEENGKKFSVQNVNKTVFESEVPGTILFALLSDDGYTAVLYQKNLNMATFLNVYDYVGNNIYNDYYENILVNGTFTENSKGLAGVFVKADTETFSTGIVQFDFEKKKKTVNQTTYSVFPYITESFNNKLFIAGANEAFYYKQNGSLSHKIQYTEKFLDYGFYNGYAVLALYDEKTLKYYLKILNPVDSEVVTIVLEKKPQKVSAKKTEIYVLTDTALSVYNYLGDKKRDITCDVVYDNFHITENALYLVGEKIIEKKSML